MPLKAHGFQIFVKPVGARCNLHCSYCYYIKNLDLFPEERSFVMSGQVLEKYIVQNIEASDKDIINFSWHGGEPLLAGISFFRQAVELQRKHLNSGRTIINGIQTNGTLIDPEWCRFFADHGFIVGISIDGPGDLHDRNRISNSGTQTSEKVLRGYELLHDHKIPAEILCVINAYNVKHPLVIYNFFKQLRALHITFLPLVNRVPGSETNVSPDSVPSLEFGIFLSTIFDEWVEKDIGKINYPAPILHKL